MTEFVVTFKPHPISLTDDSAAASQCQDFTKQTWRCCLRSHSYNSFRGVTILWLVQYSFLEFKLASNAC